MRHVAFATLWLCTMAWGADVDWAVNGGPYNIRYSELKQITLAKLFFNALVAYGH